MRGSLKPRRLRADGEAWLMMVYGSPSCNIVMLSVGVRKVGVRTELYIVPETASAITQLCKSNEPPWNPSD